MQKKMNSDEVLALFGCEWRDEDALAWARENEPLIEALNRGHGYPDEPPPAGTQEYAEWKLRNDDKQGYEPPKNTDGSPLLHAGLPTLYGMAYACMLIRRERRDARRAVEDARGKEARDRPGFVGAMRAKIAEKRAEGTPRLEKRGDGPAGENGLDGASKSVSICHSISNAISYDQERTILLILVGKSDSAIAQEIGVDRRTVFRWRQTRAFKLSLHRARQQVWEAGLDKVRTMVFESLAQLRKLMKSKESEATRLRAVRMLVGLMGMDRIAPKLDEELAKEGEAKEPERDVAA